MLHNLSVSLNLCNKLLALKLAGVPETVLNRAKELVAELSDADISQKAKDIAQYSKKLEKMNNQYKKINDLEDKQMSLFDTVKDDDIISDIKELDISNMTPIDALNTLYKLQGKVKNRW
jgi:DNA mismatch repair protein MutS